MKLQRPTSKLLVHLIHILGTVALVSGALLLGVNVAAAQSRFTEPAGSLTIINMARVAADAQAGGASLVGQLEPGEAGALLLPQQRLRLNIELAAGEGVIRKHMVIRNGRSHCLVIHQRYRPSASSKLVGTVFVDAADGEPDPKCLRYAKRFQGR